MVVSTVVLSRKPGKWLLHVPVWLYQEDLSGAQQQAGGPVQTTSYTPPCCHNKLVHLLLCVKGVGIGVFTRILRAAPLVDTAS